MYAAQYVAGIIKWAVECSACETNIRDACVRQCKLALAWLWLHMARLGKGWRRSVFAFIQSAIAHLNGCWQLQCTTHIQSTIGNNNLTSLLFFLCVFLWCAASVTSTDQLLYGHSAKPHFLYSGRAQVQRNRPFADLHGTVNFLIILYTWACSRTPSMCTASQHKQRIQPTMMKMYHSPACHRESDLLNAPSQSFIDLFSVRSVQPGITGWRRMAKPNRW